MSLANDSNGESTNVKSPMSSVHNSTVSKYTNIPISKFLSYQKNEYLPICPNLYIISILSYLAQY